MRIGVKRGTSLSQHLYGNEREPLHGSATTYRIPAGRIREISPVALFPEMRTQRDGPQIELLRHRREIRSILLPTHSNFKSFSRSCSGPLATKSCSHF